MYQRPLAKLLWYEFLRVVCRAAAVAIYRIRCRGREFIPVTGGVLVIANHQSHLDPVLIGIACDRRLNYLARESLFRFPPFRWLIYSLDGIPIDRDGMGMAGLKETLRRLKREEMVVIFPEGTRTFDGELSPLKPGFSALARRAAVPLLPVAVEGAFDAWPRTANMPRPGIIEVQFGAPLMPAETAALDDRELVAEMQRRLKACLDAARAQRNARLGSR